MMVPTFLLANHAAVSPVGLLDVVGGGWEFVGVPHLPWTVQGFAAGLIECDDDEFHADLEVDLTVELSGRPIGTQARIALRPQRRISPFAIPFTGVLRSEGVLAVRLADATGPLAELTCQVRLPPGPDVAPDVGSAP